jgi:hypothetical protein
MSIECEFECMSMNLVAQLWVDNNVIQYIVCYNVKDKNKRR